MNNDGLGWLQSIAACGLFLSSVIAWAEDYTPDVWSVIRSQFQLNHEIDRPQVQQQLRWITAHPGYVEKVAQLSEPYIYHIVKEIKNRNLPGELALIPMIESSFNPFAYSKVGAAGLWQLMPKTGTELGLRQDWWFDSRRSISSSTNAALNYFNYLSTVFNANWVLAIAAYDCGEGLLSRTISSSGRAAVNASYWTLNLPQETRNYIPRLLALAEIINNPERYKVHLPNIPFSPYFEAVYVGSQIDLDHAASMAGISYEELIKLNPGHNRSSTAPNQPYQLLIPTSKVNLFLRNLAKLPKSMRVSFDRHMVEEGDSLESLARKYHTTVTMLKQLNLLKSEDLARGQVLLLPAKTSEQNPKLFQIRKNQTALWPSEGSTRKVIHIVQANDSLLSLERKYKVTAKEIRDWNQLNANEPLKAGMQLIIMKKLG